MNESIVIGWCWGGASVVVNKILRIILHFKQDDHNIPEICELYKTLFYYSMTRITIICFN